MTAIIISLSLIVLGIVLMGLSDYADLKEIMGVVSVILGAMGMIIILISLPISRVETGAFIAQHESIRQSVLKSRLSDDNIERFSFLQSISESNAELASLKYYNSSIWLWDLWITDSIEEVKPIE